jgi:hypothetical protein
MLNLSHKSAYSVEQLLTYAKCPQLYRYLYVDKKASQSHNSFKQQLLFSFLDLSFAAVQKKKLSPESAERTWNARRGDRHVSSSQNIRAREQLLRFVVWLNDQDVLGVMVPDYILLGTATVELRADLAIRTTSNDTQLILLSPHSSTIHEKVASQSTQAWAVYNTKTGLATPVQKIAEPQLPLYIETLRRGIQTLLYWAFRDKRCTTCQFRQSCHPLDISLI